MSKDFVERLTYDQKVEILKNYKELTKNGVIGDCLLRDKSDEFTFTQTPIIRMQMLASEVALSVAYEYIEKGSKND